MKKPLENVLLSPPFVVGLGLLLLNDFYLKYEVANFVTGKLSDFAGLFVFSSFFSALVPKKKSEVYVITALFFFFWKSPCSNILIDTWNSFEFFRAGRTVDYSDLVALTVLPFSYWYFWVSPYCSGNKTTFHSSFSIPIVILSVFAFTATTLVSERNLFFEDTFFVEENHTQIEKILRQNPAVRDLQVRRDDEIFDTNKYPEIKTDRNVYFFDFNLNVRTCDSELTTMGFVVIEREGYSEIRGGTVEFKCKSYESSQNTNALDKSYIQDGRTLFRGEVVQRLSAYTKK